MIALTTAAKIALRQHGVELVAQASIGAPVTKTLTPILSEIPVIRTSASPGQRTIEVSNCSLVCDNRDGRFNDWKSGSWLYAKKWNGSPVTIQVGVRLATGALETPTVYVGFLDDVIYDFAGGSAELVLVDPFARLKRNNVGATTAGRLYTQEAPAKIVKDLLTDAGFSTYIDPASFSAEILIERVESKRIRSYTVPEDTKWWTEIESLIRQSNAGLRMSSAGLIQYFKFQPAPPGSVFTFDTHQNVKVLSHSKPGGDIENKYKVQKDDGSGAFENTANSPVQDATSVSDWGEISSVLQFGFTVDAPCENVARERLDAKAQPPRILEIEAPLDALGVELWDVVRVVDTEESFDYTGLIYQKSIDLHRGICGFRVYADTGLTNQNWLYTENAQNYDTAQKVY